MNSNREIIVELFEEHSEVNFYSIRYSDNELSEADLFFDKVLDNEELDEDVEILSKLLDKIGENGAELRHFRHAGTKSDKVAALPEYLSSTNLRLYDPFLNECVETLKQIDRFIGARIKNGQTIVFRKELMGNLKFYFKE